MPIIVERRYICVILYISSVYYFQHTNAEAEVLSSTVEPGRKISHYITLYKHMEHTDRIPDTCIHIFLFHFFYTYFRKNILYNR